MDAHKATISDIFNNSTLVEIPFFQRAYVWDKDLWQRLIEDMEYVVKSKKTHFLGSIILKAGREPSDEDEFDSCYTVVDGQQRLTTFLIFMKALCLLQGQPDAFNSQFRINGEEIALRLGKNDLESFEQVINMDSPNKIEIEKGKKRIIDAYNYFIENINPNGMNFTQIKSKALFVRINLDKNEDEQQIFDTINSLGINLTTSELLKNYFFSRETINEYHNKWEMVFENNEESKEYWERTVETGKNKRAMIDIFFDAYFQQLFQNKKFNVKTEDKISYLRVDKISQSYQHFIREYCNDDKNIVLNKIKEYADCFRDLFSPEICDMGVSGNFSSERLNILIFGLKNTTLIPYVLYITKNSENQDDLNKMYGIIESYIMRRMVAHASTQNYKNLFTSLILNEIKTSESLIEYLNKNDDSSLSVPVDDDIKNGFNNLKLTNLQTKGILYMIESKIRPHNSAVVLLGFNEYSLEHLMPKKWRNNWGFSAEEEKKKQRDSKLLTLGNLAIIPSALNSSIRDADWKTKKEGKGSGKEGLKACASGLVTLRETLEKEEWNENEIEKRAEWLCKNALKIWSL
ncbi:MAG: DUF262 domain-containing HNH endonuclease family protein [Ruminococcus sp.]|nr:DUF262 domain-containing HNH endonuclease family protein [Ruminococcus sp.]